jgi:hypothetical protein
MPYIDSLEDQNKEEQQGETPQISPGSAVFGAGKNFSNAETAQADAKKAGGQFADLNEYLRVNAPQGFGSQLAGKVDTDVKAAGDTLDQTGQEFKNRVDASTVQQDKDLVNQATGENAADFASNNDNVKAFQKQSNAEYKGPGSFEDTNDLFGKASGAAQTAAGKAKAVSTEPGRFALLDNYFGRPDYSRGQKSLDNLIAQNDPNAQQAFQQMQKDADAVGQQAKGQGGELNSYAAQGNATTAATRTAARGALGIDENGNVIGDQNGGPNAGAIGSLYHNVNSRTQDQQAAYDKDTQDIQKAVAARNLATLTPEEKQMLGLDFPTDLYAIDPSQYLSFVPKTGINLKTAASAADVARMNALTKLADLNDPYFDSSLAGTAPTNFANFDKAGFQNAITTSKNAYTSKENEINSNIQNLVNAARTRDHSLYTPKSYLDQIKQQYDSLNAIRAQYGLAPVANQYSDVASLDPMRLSPVVTPGGAKGGSTPLL